MTNSPFGARRSVLGTHGCRPSAQRRSRRARGTSASPSPFVSRRRQIPLRSDMNLFVLDCERERFVQARRKRFHLIGAPALMEPANQPDIAVEATTAPVPSFRTECRRAARFGARDCQPAAKSRQRRTRPGGRSRDRRRDFLCPASGRRGGGNWLEGDVVRERCVRHRDAELHGLRMGWTLTASAGSADPLLAAIDSRAGAVPVPGQTEIDPSFALNPAISHNGSAIGPTCTLRTIADRPPAEATVIHSRTSAPRTVLEDDATAHKTDGAEAAI